MRRFFVTDAVFLCWIPAASSAGTDFAARTAIVCPGPRFGVLAATRLNRQLLSLGLHSEGKKGNS